MCFDCWGYCERCLFFTAENKNHFSSFGNINNPKTEATDDSEMHRVEVPLVGALRVSLSTQQGEKEGDE